MGCLPRGGDVVCCAIPRAAGLICFDYELAYCWLFDWIGDVWINLLVLSTVINVTFILSVSRQFISDTANLQTWSKFDNFPLILICDSYQSCWNLSVIIMHGTRRLGT